MVALKLTAREVKDALLKRHGMDVGDGAWACIEEAFCGWRSSGGGIDLFAMACHSSARRPGMERFNGPDGQPVFERVDHPIVSYEVKVSRSDFRRELKGTSSRRGRLPRPWPYKAQHALARSHHFIFAVPLGLLTDLEIAQREPWPDGGPSLWLPPEAGLVEVDAAGKVRSTVKAPRLKPRQLQSHEIAELLRHGTTPASMRSAVARASALEARLATEVERSQGYFAEITELRGRIDDGHPADGSIASSA